MTERELLQELTSLASKGTNEMRGRFNRYRSAVMDLAKKLEFQANSALKPKGQSVKFKWNWMDTPEGVRFLQLSGSGRSDAGAQTLLRQFDSDASTMASQLRAEIGRATERYQSAANQAVAASGLGGSAKASVLWMNQQMGPNTPRLQFKRQR